MSTDQIDKYTVVFFQQYSEYKKKASQNVKLVL